MWQLHRSDLDPRRRPKTPLPQPPPRPPLETCSNEPAAVHLFESIDPVTVNAFVGKTPGKRILENADRERRSRIDTPSTGNRPDWPIGGIATSVNRVNQVARGLTSPGTMQSRLRFRHTRAVLHSRERPGGRRDVSTTDSPRRREQPLHPVPFSRHCGYRISCIKWGDSWPAHAAVLTFFRSAPSRSPN